MRTRRQFLGLGLAGLLAALLPRHWYADAAQPLPASPPVTLTNTDGTWGRDRWQGRTLRFDGETWSEVDTKMLLEEVPVHFTSGSITMADGTTHVFHSNTTRVAVLRPAVRPYR